MKEWWRRNRGAFELEIGTGLSSRRGQEEKEVELSSVSFHLSLRGSTTVPSSDAYNLDIIVRLYLHLSTPDSKLLSPSLLSSSLSPSLFLATSFLLLLQSPFRPPPHRPTLTVPSLTLAQTTNTTTTRIPSPKRMPGSSSRPSSRTKVSSLNSSNPSTSL